MAIAFDSLNDIRSHGFDAVIDARAPAEFAEDHIPGAINLPVLDDAERAEVGTIYKQDSAFKAKKVGAALVARNAARHLEGPLAEMDGAWQPLVYCWRGGQRSGSFATILKQVGWRAETVEGGYQTYRRLVAAAMHDDPLAYRLVVLDGNTGTAKTDLLRIMAGRGHQVVDLEGMAAHRGSIFGATDQSQPSQKAFESGLAFAFADLDPARPVLVEAESSKIGRILVPPSVWDAMKTAPRISVSASLQERASYLVRAYSDIVRDRDALDDRLTALVQHQGHETVTHWKSLAAAGDMAGLASALMENHYDPSYARSRAVHASRQFAEVALAELSPDGLTSGATKLEAELARLGNDKAA